MVDKTPNVTPLTLPPKYRVQVYWQGQRRTYVDVPTVQKAQECQRAYKRTYDRAIVEIKPLHF